MAKVQIRSDLRELRRERALRQEDLGSFWTVLQVEKGRRLPGPSTLSRWAAALSLPPVVVMDACRESQRRALVARGRSGSGLVKGAGSRRSCHRYTAQGGAKVRQ